MSTWRSRLFRHAAARRPERPVGQPEGGPPRLRRPWRGSDRHGTDACGGLRSGPAPDPVGRPADQALLTSAAAVGGHAEGYGAAVSPVCGAAAHALPPGGRAVACAGDGGGASGARGAQDARRAVRRKGRFLVLPPGPCRVGPQGAAVRSPAAGAAPGVPTAAGPARPPHRWKEPPQVLPHVRNQPCPPCGESFAREYGTNRVARPPARRPPAPVLSAGMPRRTPRLSRPRRGGM